MNYIFIQTADGEEGYYVKESSFTTREPDYGYVDKSYKCLELSRNPDEAMAFPSEQSAASKCLRLLSYYNSDRRYKCQIIKHIEII